MTRRRLHTLLPLLVAVISTIIVNAIPLLRAYVLREEAFLVAGWALYFFTVPGCVVQLIVGGIASAALAYIKNDRTHAIVAYIAAGIIGLGFIGMLVLVCQPA